jgi:hypothetical protein
MAEIFFILTTVFVAYVVYVTVGDQIDDIKSITSKSAKAETDTVSEPVKIVEEQVVPVSVAKTEEPKAQAAQKKHTKVAAGASSAAKSLKDPATGDVVNMPNNYRFAKRWIKDALVSEGLLPKVYKNNELDDKTNSKIKTALNKLAKLEQYKT